MDLIRGIHNIKPEHCGCVLTIGNFDGVHLGHQDVISRVVAKAKAMALPATLMVFEPQPQELFAPAQAPARLTRLRDKFVYLSALGIDRLLVVNFNHKFAKMTADAFVEQLLVEKLGVKHLIVGDDFHFGVKRQGDYQMLQSRGAELGYSVENSHTFCHQSERISSTRIRQALANDQLAEVEQMLGHGFTLYGRVAHGDKRGRELGFPTCNIALKRKVSPVSGVFCVKVKGAFGHRYGVANIGARPTVSGVRSQLEVHLFDFEGDLYGQQLEVKLLRKLRQEQKFSNLAELQQQIEKDVTSAKAFLANVK